MRVFILLLFIYATIVLPYFLIVVRNTIKSERQRIINDLDVVFMSGKYGYNIIPSFEFVKYKYDLRGDRNNIENKKGEHSDHSIFWWVISPLTLSFISGVMTFLIMNYLFQNFDEKSSGSIGIFNLSNFYSTKTQVLVIFIGISSAFIGGYISLLRNLFRAIRNFDFSPATIFNETIKLLTGMAVGAILAIVLAKYSHISSQSTAHVTHTFWQSNQAHGTINTVPIILMCFIAGLLPDLIIRNILNNNIVSFYKNDNKRIFGEFPSYPVEIIDGIDTQIRSRLEDHHIFSLQNLATANPLMLFVETPYGVYQIMDWVAQAQLCCSVGSRNVQELRSIGIRTLFDLERLASNKSRQNKFLIIHIGRILFSNGQNLLEYDSRADVNAVSRSIELRLDDPYVHRLRQIYMAVGDRLGRATQRFPSEINAYMDADIPKYGAHTRSFSGGLSPPKWRMK